MGSIIHSAGLVFFASTAAIPAIASTDRDSSAWAPIAIVATVSAPRSETAFPILTVAPDGQIWGTSHVWPCRGGSVFRIDASGTPRVVHKFRSGDAAHGFHPLGIAFEPDGSLVGVAAGGPSPDGHEGLLYRIEHGGRFSVLHTFDASTGCTPIGPPTVDHNGVVYGVTLSGGIASDNSAAQGVVYAVSPAGEYRVIHTFINDGMQSENWPSSPLTVDEAGNLYGTVRYGGDCTNDPEGAGAIYRIDESGKYTLLHAFTSTGDGGIHPAGRLLIDPSGALIGMTLQSGDSDGSALYRLSTDGRLEVLHTFTGGHGSLGLAPLAFDGRHSIYGICAEGLFRIDSLGRFDLVREGVDSSFQLVGAGDDALFATTAAGAILRIDTARL